MKQLKRGALASGLLALSAGAGFATQVDIVVDKASQHMHVTVDGEMKYDWLVSTGAPGHDTPSGHFHIFRFDKNHFSKEWDDAPMPNSMFFTALGHAIHGSSHIARLGTPASHGCVRLAPENAAILWDIVQKAGIENNSVTIKGGLFDKELTTAETFHMSSDDLHQVASQDDGDNQPSRPLFWWLKPHASEKQASKEDVQPQTWQTQGTKKASADKLKKGDKKLKVADAKKKLKKKKPTDKPADKPADAKPEVVGAN